MRESQGQEVSWRTESIHLMKQRVNAAKGDDRISGPFFNSRLLMARQSNSI